LSARRGDLQPHAANVHRRIGGVDIGGGEVEASDCRILPGMKHRGIGEGHALAVRLEDTGETDSLDVVAAMPERRTSARGECIHHLARREPLRREPARRVSERGRGGTEHERDQHHRANSDACG